MLEACEEGSPRSRPTSCSASAGCSGVVVDWFERHGGDRYPLSPRRGRPLVLGGVAPLGLPAEVPGRPARRVEPTPTPRSATSPSATPAPGLPWPRRPAVRGGRGEAVQPALVRRQERPLLRPGRADRRLHGRVLRRAGRDPSRIDDLAFLILAPQARVDDGVFARDTAIDAIREGPPARRRLRGRARRLVPRLVRADPRPGRRPLPAWEDVIDAIAFHDPAPARSSTASTASASASTAPARRPPTPAPGPRLEPALDGNRKVRGQMLDPRCRTQRRLRPRTIALIDRPPRADRARGHPWGTASSKLAAMVPAR